MMLPGFETEERDHDASQWFTEPELADRMWQWAKAGGQHRAVLEPSAGPGALARAVLRHPGQCWRLAVVEQDARLVPDLSAMRRMHADVRVQVFSADFLRLPLPDSFDVGFMNPPYEGGQTEAHVLKALEHCGRVVVLAQNGFLHGVSRRDALWSKTVITRGVWLSRRPRFGTGDSGSKTAMRDFVVLELRHHVALPGEAMTCTWEWW